MNSIIQIAKFKLFFGALLALVFTSSAWASHPYHVSKTEMAFNPKSGNFEVALCVWPADLEKALTAKSGKTVDLDKAEDLDALLKDYVESKFSVRKNTHGKKGDTQASIRWVGHEKNNKEAWLYFEVAGDKDQADWTVKNEIFFELNEDQLNQIQFKIERDTKSFISTIATKPHAISTVAKAKVKIPVAEKKS